MWTHQGGDKAYMRQAMPSICHGAWHAAVIAAMTEHALMRLVASKVKAAPLHRLLALRGTPAQSE